MIPLRITSHRGCLRMAKMTKKTSMPAAQSKVARRRAALKWILKLTVPIIAILYTFTSGFHVWDDLFGRTEAASSPLK